MKRVIDNEIEKAISEKVTDSMVEAANRVIDRLDPNLRSRETDERIVWFFGHRPNTFAIRCETKSDHRLYKFDFDDNGNVEYQSLEGDFR